MILYLGSFIQQLTAYSGTDEDKNVVPAVDFLFCVNEGHDKFNTER